MLKSSMNCGSPIWMKWFDVKFSDHSVMFNVSSAQGRLSCNSCGCYQGILDRKANPAGMLFDIKCASFSYLF